MLKISPAEVAPWAELIAQLSGIRIDSSKAYLLETRLAPMARDLNATTASELFFKIKADATGKLKSQLVERMTTRETSFFRDQSPFQLIENKLLPELIDRVRLRNPNARVPIRIWSAAASSGQEIYTVAMLLRNLLGTDPRYAIRLLATDISHEAIAYASRASYDPFEIDRGLPHNFRQRFFTPDGKRWKLSDEIRAMVAFRQLNLLQDFSHLGTFDIILCRNVAIYFSEADKRDLFNRIGRVLDPNGSLIIGSTESLSGLCPQFASKRHLRAIFYQLAVNNHQPPTASTATKPVIHKPTFSHSSLTRTVL